MAPPATYVHGHHAAVLRAHAARTAADSAAHLLPHLVAGASLLDVGCGPGSITADLAALLAPGRVVGVDADAGVVAAAAALAARRGLTNTAFEVADVHALPFADGSFDVVHAHQVLQHLADPVAALREVRRVTAPGGLVAVRDADYAAMTWYPELPGLERWRSLYRATARASGGEPDAGRRLLAWAGEAGFTDVRASASTWCWSTDAARAWWAGTWSERVTSSRFAEQALAAGLATRRELADLSAAWLAWADAPGAWFAVLHGEVLARA